MKAVWQAEMTMVWRPSYDVSQSWSEERKKEEKRLAAGIS